VTLVFTDVESSTRLMEELDEDEYREALARHREVVRSAFGEGYEVDYEGDAFFYAFAPQCRRRVHRASRTPPSRSTRRR
jgi:class 3 adenylate cyclase